MNRCFDFNRHFFRLFPNIQKIEYAIANHTQIELINNQFPCLKHVDFQLDRVKLSRSRGKYPYLNIMYDDPEFLEMIPYMVSFLRLNPQIRSLTTFLIFSETFLDVISENLPLLENLKFFYMPKDILNYGNNFENLKKINFHCSNRNFNNTETVSKRMKRVLSFDQLEEFACFSYNLDIQEFYDIISRYPSIVKLGIRDRNDLWTIDPLELAIALPKLAEIDLRNCRMYDPIPFICKIHTLRKFSFRYYTAGERHEDLLKRLLAGWHTTKTNQKGKEITIERKI